MKTKDFYDFAAIEEKWQRFWEEHRTFEVSEDPQKQKYYVLEMFIYPSGKPHMGHVRNYSIGDAYARFKRMRGYNVLHPFGYDAFGLPAENAAIKHGIHPEKWTFDNIDAIRAALKRLGFSYDWSREITTCLPEYYKWNQWFFVKMYERGLAYKKMSWVNWCTQCQTVLANEQVVGGCCWRHQETPVIQRELEQWFLKITAYAEELLEDTYKMKDWPEKVLVMQRNWIGKSEGANVDFQIEGGNKAITIFTTRIDTIYGANAILVSPEHPIVAELARDSDRAQHIRAFCEKMKRTVRSERLAADLELEKEGVFTGRHAINPFSGERLPIWLANFVLMEYGTGAIMSVPAHDQRDFEFSKKYDLPIRVVIWPLAGELRAERMREAFVEYGRLVDSGQFSGLTSEDAMKRMTAYAEERGFGKRAISYRLKDWLISRQRFWGTPIPIIYCDKCGVLPVPIERLPVLLPSVSEINPRGGSPLAQVPEFVNTACPKCEGPARRETDTMDTFVDSSWYFYRYCDPRNDAAPFAEDPIRYWFPIDFYIGGIEHATMHLIYMRFFAKVMRDLGLVDHDEPVTWYFPQGMVTKDGSAMSKSRGNVVEPEDMIAKYGADTLRLFILFAAPPENDLEWSDQGIEGCYRFLNRFYRLVNKHASTVAALEPLPPDAQLDEAGRALQRKLHQTIRRITVDIDERLHLNTAIAAIMELLNAVQDFEATSLNSLRLLKGVIENMVLLLAPFTPHLCEELWERLGHRESLAYAPWPSYDPALAAEEQLEIPVQVNGRLRSRILVSADSDGETVKALAQSDPKVRQHIAGRQILNVIYVPKRLVNIVVK